MNKEVLNLLITLGAVAAVLLGVWVCAIVCTKPPKEDSNLTGSGDLEKGKTATSDVSGLTVSSDSVTDAAGTGHHQQKNHHKGTHHHHNHHHQSLGGYHHHHGASSFTYHHDHNASSGGGHHHH